MNKLLILKRASFFKVEGLAGNADRQPEVPGVGMGGQEQTGVQDSMEARGPQRVVGRN